MAFFPFSNRFCVFFFSLIRNSLQPSNKEIPFKISERKTMKTKKNFFMFRDWKQKKSEYSTDMEMCFVESLIWFQFNCDFRNFCIIMCNSNFAPACKLREWIKSLQPEEGKKILLRNKLLSDVFMAFVAQKTRTSRREKRKGKNC
jgi:hypothetical protein